MAVWYVKDRNGVSLELTVRPKAGRGRVGPVTAGRLKVETRAPAEDGKANAEVVKLLAKRLGVRRNQLRIVTGQTSRRKTVRVDAALDVSVLARMEQGD
jgi:uncharacterized protein (TIGR00251 family)